LDEVENTSILKTGRLASYRWQPRRAAGYRASDLVLWPIATGHILTGCRRFRDIADMDQFSSRNEL